MSETNFEIKINVPMIKELVSDKIYRSDASAFREQYVNALSHGCVAYHQEYGYTDDVNVHVEFDYGLRKVTITDNGMGMSKNIFSDNFMSFGFSTVSKDENNTRSGMFGLGAISFFRIASACIVESWDRKTEERFTFMTRNTDESEFVENRTLETYGTKTEIFLKEHVRMNTLVDMVKTIAKNYPVKTILETSNSESEQTISTYNNTDGDSYIDYQPVMRFKDYVKDITDDRFVTLIDSDEMELYLSTVGGNKNHTYLCRIPIDISYSTGFTTYLNIKKEKIKGTDSKGRDKLQEVPKPDRDEVNEIATDYFSKVIEKSCDDMIHDIDIKNFDEYKESDERWILNGYSVDDKLNQLTHSFVQQMREPVRYRTVDGIQKRHATLLTLFGEYKSIMFHPSLHKGTFDAINKHLNDENSLAMVDNTCDQPLIDAKAYKKEHKIKSVITHGSGGSAKGLLVRDGSWNNHRLTSDDPEDSKKRYPGGLYFGDGWIEQHDINSVYETSECKWINELYKRNKSGIIIAKKAKKLYPSITELFDKIIKASEDGQIIHMITPRRKHEHSNTNIEQFTKVSFNEGNEELKELEIQDNIEGLKQRIKHNTYRNINQVFGRMYGTMILPIQCKKSLPFLKHINVDILFVPTKLIHAIQLTGSMGQTSYKAIETLTQLKHSPQWTTWSENGSALAWSKYMRFNSRYGSTNYKCRNDIMQYLVDIEDGVKQKPNESEYDSYISEILDSYDEPSYQYDLSYDKMFPTMHLQQRAKDRGFLETEIKKDSSGKEKVIAYANEKDGYKPMKIDGHYYCVKIVNGDDGWEAKIDDDGNPQLIKTTNNYDISYHNDELVFRDEIDEWS